MKWHIQNIIIIIIIIIIKILGLYLSLDILDPFPSGPETNLNKWTKGQDKLMTMHKALHPRDDVDRLYVSRKEGGRGLASIEDSVGTSIHRLENYIQKHEERLITATRHKTENTMNNRMTITRKQKWEGKQLYGRFKRLKNISHTTKLGHG